VLWVGALEVFEKLKLARDRGFYHAEFHLSKEHSTNIIDNIPNNLVALLFSHHKKHIGYSFVCFNSFESFNKH
jgi:hypothetical protein